MFTKINLRILSAKERALLNAVSDEDLAKVKTLVVDHNVNVNIRDSLERSPLMRTSFVANNEAREGMTKIFLQNGAGPNMVDLHGRSALMLACREENKEDMVKLLMQCTRTDPNLQDEDGNTALVQAIEYENVAVVRTLLTEDYSHRVDVNVENFESKTAIVIAAKLKNKEICSLLTSTGNVDLSNVPNHLTEYLPEEFQRATDEVKDKERESRSTSTKGTPTDVQPAGHSSHPSSPKLIDSSSPSPNRNPQPAANHTAGEPLEESIPYPAKDEKERPQDQQNGRSSTSNIPSPQNVDTVDDKVASLGNNTAVGENQRESEDSKHPKQEEERPLSKGRRKESPTGGLSQTSSENKVVQRMDRDTPESQKAESEQEDGKMLKEKESKEPTNKTKNKTDDRTTEISEKANEGGITEDEEKDVRATSNEKSASKQTEERKEEREDAEVRPLENKEDERHEQQNDALNSKEVKRKDVEAFNLERNTEAFSGHKADDPKITKSDSNLVIVSENESQEVKNVSRKNGIESQLPMKNTVVHKSEVGDDMNKQRRSSLKESTEKMQEKELRNTEQSEDTTIQRNKRSPLKSSKDKTGSPEVEDVKTSEKDRKEQRRSSIEEKTRNSKENEVQNTKQSEDSKLQRHKESLEKTSSNETGTQEDKDVNNLEKQHSAIENSSTETVSVIDERKKTSKNNEPLSDDPGNTLTKHSSKAELKKSDLDDFPSSLESEKQNANYPSKPVASDPATKNHPSTNRSSPDQSISAASFISEPPPGVQRSPEKPRGWTAPAVATVPTAVNKWKKRANERGRSKGHRKRPLRVEDQTPYVTKSGRVIHPNSVHDQKYDDIQEVRTASRMSRMDMALQLMLRENSDRPQAHSANPRRNSRKMSRQSSKNTIA